MEVEAQVAHFRRLSTVVLSVSGPRRALELGQLAGNCPLPCYPRHPLCSPTLTPVSPPSGRHFCETAQHD
eukprot:4411068-Prymnesium_polylepis.1